MDWAGKPHPVEALAEWLAPMVLAAAVAWAASAVGLPLAAKAGSGVLALSVGIVAMRMAGRPAVAGQAEFEPVALDASNAVDVLLLEDALVEPAPDSRVVRLFERKDATPGELVLRISDYLIEQGKEPVVDHAVDNDPVDASAALHAALANIRANLR